MNIELRRGDRLRLWTTGGGGYGNPLERPLSAVLADVVDDKVSVTAARDIYGLVFDGKQVDEAKATRLRDTRRETRPATSPLAP